MGIPFIKPGTFLSDYMSYMSEQETPLVYDFATACWVLSVVLGRDVVVDRPRAVVHLNMYAVLVSDSGIMRKSTSVRMGTSLIRTYLEQTRSKALLIESKMTRGMLENELSRATQECGNCHVIISASELAAVLARGGGVSSLTALLTDLYDCPDTRLGGGSLASGSINLRNVYASFFAGSTPSWLGRAVSPEVIEGGFTSRCFFITAGQRKRTVAWPSGGNEAESKLLLLRRLCSIQEASKRYSLIGITPHARDTFTTWYNTRPSHKDAYRESFESREDSHVLRFAGLFAANEQVWLISDDHIRRAIEFVREIKRNGTELFSPVQVSREDVHLIKKVQSELLAAGTIGLSRSELYRSLAPKVRSGELNNILSTLHELDLVKMTEVKMPYGRPKTVFTATEYLRSDVLLQEVSRRLGIE